MNAAVMCARVRSTISEGRARHSRQAENRSRDARSLSDRNPVAAVRQRPEPPGRDRIVSPAEFRTLSGKAEGDREMRAFLALAGTTTMRTGEVLSLRGHRTGAALCPHVTM